MTQDELTSLIDNEERQALRPQGEISAERTLGLKYYNGELLGNEVEGRSQVVSSDVFDIVEGMIPPIIKTFAATDKAVEFDPVGLEDEEASKQATSACNHVFYKQNNGVLILYTWIKDGLLGKNGTVKWYYENRERISTERYDGMTDQEFQQLVSQDDVEVLEHTEYADEDGEKQLQDKVQQFMQSPQVQQMQAMGQAIPTPPPVPPLHDIKIRVKSKTPRVCIVPVPPEEFLVSASHNSIDLEDCGFCEHRSEKTYSDLREMGFSDKDLEDIGDGDNDDQFNTERIARKEFPEAIHLDNIASADDSLRKVWVGEGYIRADVDGDGVAELIRFIKAGKKVLEYEEADEINFASFSPIVMAHRFTGKSIADVTMDFQTVNTVLWRQMLDNIYLTNNPRHAVVENQANLDDLLTSRPGGIVRMKAPGAVTPLETPFVAQHSLTVLEYNEGRKENRTGVTRYSQGTDADSLNKTAHGIQMIQTAAQQRPDLIARLFAETGFKRLFRGIKRELYKSGLRKLSIRLNGKYVNVDPREWKHEWDMTVNVGLGTGNKDQQLVHLEQMFQKQVAFIQMGKGYMVSDTNLHNTASKIAENSGFKHVEAFYTNPESVPDEAKKPQPNPEMIKLQAEQQMGQAKLQATDKLKQMELQSTQGIEQGNMQLEKYKVDQQIASQERIAIAQIDAQKEIEKMRLDHAAHLKVFDANTTAQVEGAKLDFEAEKFHKENQPQEEVGNAAKSLGETAKQHAEGAAAARDGIVVAASELAKAAQVIGKSTEGLAKTVDGMQKAVANISRPKKGSFNGKPFTLE